MILQALVHHYDVLLKKGKLEKPGWLSCNVSWALELNSEGCPIRLVNIENPVVRGKKTVYIPQKMNLPEPVKRSSGVAANALGDNASYVFGLDTKGKAERSVQCFEAMRELHEQLLGNVDHPAAKAVIRYFQTWNPRSAADHSLIRNEIEALGKGGGIVFLYEGRYVQDIPELKEAWDESYQQDEQLPIRQCLVTGQTGPIAMLHPSIKGVAGAQAMGASLISFNCSAFESYGCESDQGLNAPVGKQAAFAYGAALNYLISNRTDGERHSNMIRLSDMSIIFWSENAENSNEDLFAAFMESRETTDEDLYGILQRLLNGQNVNWNGEELDADSHFYVLGLSPNAARLSVRFFLCDTFGKLMQNIATHQQRLEMVKPAYEKRSTLSLWGLLNETVNQNSKDKTPSPQVSGELMRAVLNNTPYPMSLYEQIQMRIRAEKNINWGKASVIKAYFMKNLPNIIPKEVVTMILNEETSYRPYVLGRLFAVLEGLQQAANGDTNTTIRDRYFNSACATPAIVFPTLIRLAQAHLKKLSIGSGVYYNKLITDLLGKIDTEYPKRLNLYDQGVFQLGYYHQTQKRFTKEDK